jgi:cytochrome c oxidase cbb3-type subunit 3/ubiquinol-cytochrome c reductase cytochrome c subunit
MSPRWNILALAAALVSLVGCGKALPGRPTTEDIVLAPSKVTDFNQLYNQNCAGCHGLDGKGSGSMPLANPVYLAIADDAVLTKAIGQGVPNSMMPGFLTTAGGFLTDEQVDILVKGIRSRWGKADALGGAKAPPYAATSAGNPANGETVFAKSCASCHDNVLQKGDKIASIVDGSFLALVTNQYLRTTVIAGRPDLGHPDWRGVNNQPLTPEQVTDVVSWLVSQRPTDPGRPYPQ